jgi:hypothetical protein
MKVISYNISDSKPWKVERLLAMEADVWVVPEITCPEDAHLPEELEMQWRGIDYVYYQKKWKGLGIIWKKGQGFIPEWNNPEMNYGIPLIVDDYLILGIWPTKKLKAEEKKLYPQIAQEIIKEYAPHFKDYKTLIIGDFNCYVNQRDSSKEYGDILRVNDVLQSYGLHSIYHQQTGEAFGQESVYTYFHHFHEDDPYFLDYAYTNVEGSFIRLFPWDKEMSDHIGMEVII